MQQYPFHRATFEALEPRRLLSAGDQDLSYGDNGFVKLQFGETVYQFVPGSDPLGEATIVSMSADQKSFSVRRFDNGIPDEGAGAGGTLATNTLPFTVAKNQRVTPDRIWSLSGGRTLIEFDIAGTSPGHESCFIRLNPDFSLDSTYGDGGKRFFNFRLPRQMRQQGDMFVIQNGTGNVGRVTDDLQPDPSFGTSGVIDLRHGGQLLLQPDGKILVAVNTGLPSVKVYRFTADGQTDTTFGGGDGLAVGGLIGSVVGTALDAQGRVVLTGTRGLTRLTSAGLLDESFGQDGLSVPFADFGEGSTFGAVLPDGTMILPDESQVPGGDAFLRIDEDGTYDQSFGRVAARLGEFANPHTLSITFDDPQTAQVQPDGSVLVGRRFSNGSYFQVRIAGDGNDPGPITLSNGVLNVGGTEQNDHILFTPGNEEPVTALLNSVGRLFPLADVTTFQASGGAGSDVIAVAEFLP
ncbi:MAG: delta-60 repeat domain-containing protein, partial [Tepidisphaeraceae bacterium]